MEFPVYDSSTLTQQHNLGACSVLFHMTRELECSERPAGLVVELLVGPAAKENCYMCTFLVYCL